MSIEEANKLLLDAIENKDMSIGDRSKTVERALKEGANPNITNKEGIPVLLLCGDIVAEILLDNGANVDATYKGANALHIAALENYYYKARVLIQHHIDINARNANSITPLMVASRRPTSSDFIELLLKNGANPNLKSKNGHTALDLATDPAIRKLLADAMGIKLPKEEEPKEKAYRRAAYKEPKPKEVEAVEGVTPYAILGIPADATDAQILGISEKELKDKNAVKTAYRQLSKKWHPDKIKENPRYTQPDVEELSDEQKVKLATMVTQLINAAYERHK